MKYANFEKTSADAISQAVVNITAYLYLLSLEIPTKKLYIISHHLQKWAIKLSQI